MVFAEAAAHPKGVQEIASLAPVVVPPTPAEAPSPARFSPTRTKSWLTCPVLYGLTSVDRWRSRLLTKRDLSAIFGTAVHRGAAVYHRALMEGRPVTLTDAVTPGVEYVRSELSRLAALGCAVRPEDSAIEFALLPSVAKALKAYTEWTFPPDWTITHVEHTVEAWGWCRLDLGVRTPLGPMVVDLKTKLALDPRYRATEIERYATEFQLRHYAAAYSDVLGEPVRDVGIILLVATPKVTIDVLPYTLTPESLLAWRQSTDRIWTEMAGEPYQNLVNCHTRFGRCEMYDACHVAQYDEGLMRQQYVQVPRREDD